MAVHQLVEHDASIRQVVVPAAYGRDRAVGQDDFQGEHVIDGRSVNRRMRAGGIVGDHAAEGGPTAGGHVRPEP